MMAYKHLPKFNENSYAHFLTTRTYKHRPYFEDKELCQILMEELEFYSRKHGFTVVGYVIMPDHLHLLLWWDKKEKPDLSISKVMQVVKGVAARRIIGLLKDRGLEQMLQSTPINHDPKSHRQNLKYCIWQPGFYDFNIYNEATLLEKLNYIHNNPVKTGLVPSACDYKWSSYKDYFGEEKDIKPRR